jgi:hypothetical protein
MTKAYNNRRPLFILPMIFILACGIMQPAPDSQQLADQVATSVALTVTELSKTLPATDAPSPTSTEFASPTATEFVPPTATLIPTLVVPVITATATPVYTCDIIDQRPRDDTQFRPNEKFDVKWTIINNGTKKWPDGTILEYLNGAELTWVTSLEMPRLKPGEKFEVVLDAITPDEQERHVMAWAVKAPGESKNTFHWMCYPYIRIIVGK